MRKVIFLALCAVFFLPNTARAQGAVSLEDWLEQCSVLAKRELNIVRRFSELVVVALSGAEPGLHGLYEVELSSPPRRAFVEKAGLGLSPVGEFPDWQQAPEGFRSGFDALLGCVDELGAPRLASASPSPLPLSLSRPNSPPRSSSWPWRLVLSLLGLGILLGARWRRPETPELLALGLIPLTFAFRLLVAPLAYLHQNGQGPLWVSYALGAPGFYGPGYRQLYFWAVRSAENPDLTLLLVQAALGACIPLLLFVGARLLGVGRLLSFALAIAVATNPAFMRSAQSESYFATATFWVTVAGVLLLWSFREMVQASGRLWSLPFVAGIVASGSIIAQLALVHPFGWLPSACLPALAFLVPSPRQGTRSKEGRSIHLSHLKLQLFMALVAGAGIALCVLLLSGAEMWAVLHNELGQNWLGGSNAHHSSPPLFRLLIVGICLALALALPPLRQLALSLAVAAALWSVLRVSSVIVLHTTPALRAAHDLMFWPQILLALAAAFACWPAKFERGIAGLSLALAVAVSVASADAVFTLPTDVREEVFALDWADELPYGARVRWLERSGRFVSTLPLRYPQTRTSKLVVDEESGEPVEAVEVPSFEPGSFYYRSSLCSTALAHSYCQQIEAAHELKLRASERFPALGSVTDLKYLGPEVEVALFEVLGPAVGKRE